MKYIADAQSLHGGTISVTDAATGKATYTPKPGYAGPDSFTFKATDSSNAASNTATISVTVINQPPIAQAGEISTFKNKAVPFKLNATDPDAGDVLTYSADAQSLHGGTITITDAATGKATYTPKPGYAGPDSFTFKATDSSNAQAILLLYL